MALAKFSKNVLILTESRNCALVTRSKLRESSAIMVKSENSMSHLGVLLYDLPLRFFLFYD